MEEQREGQPCPKGEEGEEGKNVAVRAKESSPGTSGFPVSAKTLVGYIIMQSTRRGQWLRDTDAQA